MDGQLSSAFTGAANPVALGIGAPEEGHLRSGRAAAHLRAIVKPGVNLAIWERPVPRGIHARLDGPAATDWPGGRSTIAAERARTDIMASLGRGRAASCPLMLDIGRLVRLYADIVGARRVEVRLETVTGEGCRYLHSDTIGIRLLCTYRGKGTLWLPNDAAERGALGSGDNGAVAPDPARIRMLGAGHVALLKGEKWPGNRGNGIIHRSLPPDPAHGPACCFASTTRMSDMPGAPPLAAGSTMPLAAGSSGRMAIALGIGKVPTSA